MCVCVCVCERVERERERERVGGEGLQVIMQGISEGERGWGLGEGGFTLTEY
jgi:hypothetical protein